jgi:hypothetical protein
MYVARASVTASFSVTCAARMPSSSENTSSDNTQAVNSQPRSGSQPKHKPQESALRIQIRRMLELMVLLPHRSQCVCPLIEMARRERLL